MLQPCLATLLLRLDLWSMAIKTPICKKEDRLFGPEKGSPDSSCLESGGWDRAAGGLCFAPIAFSEFQVTLKSLVERGMLCSVGGREQLVTIKKGGSII